MEISINLLKIFLTIAECGSITKAASELHITQQALSRNLQQLEEEMGTQLFFRSGHGTKLTLAGERVLPAVKLILSRYEDGMQTIETILRKDSYSIKVAFDNLVRINAFPSDLLSRFGAVKAYAYVAGDEQTCLAHVLSGEATCAYMYKPKKLGDLLFYPVIRNRPVVIMSKKHRLAKRSELTLNDIRDEAHSWLSIKSGWFDDYFSACLESGFYPNISSEFPTAELHLSLLHEGKEITVSGNSLISANESELRRVPLIHKNLFVEFGFVYSPKYAEDKQLMSYFSAVKHMINP